MIYKRYFFVIFIAIPYLVAAGIRRNREKEIRSIQAEAFQLIKQIYGLNLPKKYQDTVTSLIEHITKNFIQKPKPFPNSPKLSLSESKKLNKKKFIAYWKRQQQLLQLTLTFMRDLATLEKSRNEEVSNAKQKIDCNKMPFFV